MSSNSNFITVLDEKNYQPAEIEHKENSSFPPTLEQSGVPVSRFADISQKEAVKNFWLATLFCILASWAAISDGYALAMPGSIIANQGFINKFARGTDPTTGALTLTAHDVSAWGGTTSAGQILGMVLQSYSGDIFGRRTSLLVMSLFLALATVLEMVANDWKVWLIAKLISGIGTGIMQAATPLYIAEIAPSQLRGFLLSFYSFFFSVGQFSSAIVLNFTNKREPLNYKVPIYVEWAFVGFYIPIVLFLLPESPWYLSMKGQDDKSREMLRKIFGGVPGYDVDHEYQVLKASVLESAAAGEVQKAASWKAIFQGTDLRRTWVSFFPFCMQQLFGVPLIFGYITYFFTLVGVKDSFLIVIIVNVVGMVGVLIGTFTTDFIGRRPLIIGGGIVMSSSLLAVGVAGSVGTSSAGNQALIAFSIIWVIAYGCSIGPLGYAYTAESSRTQLRAKTEAFATAGTSCVGLIFNYSVPYMLNKSNANWGLKTGYFFGALGIIATAVAFFTIPETSRRSYSELDELFSQRVPSRKFKDYQTTVDIARKEHLG